jgi:hypothetical protein
MLFKKYVEYVISFINQENIGLQNSSIYFVALAKPFAIGLA